jgi:hypothetical protein
MRRNYEAWLRNEGYDENTVNAQLYRAGRVEQYYGDFDEHFEADRLESVIEAFVYSADDARRKRPNPTLIPFMGAITGNMNGYKFAVRLYLRYRDGTVKAEGEELELAPTLKPSIQVSKREDRSSSDFTFRPTENPVTLVEFGIDGFAALQALITGSNYKSLTQAVASLTLFSHPKTVQQTLGKSIFKTIRGPRTPGVYIEQNGKRLMLDDNKSASDAFKWANGITGRARDVQFNHVYTSSQDVDSYTSLANICVTPAFLAKLTDNTSPMTSALLKYRVFELYGWLPAGIEAPNKPEGYDELDWAPTLPAISNVRASLEARMARRPKDRTVLSVKEVGWLFDEGDIGSGFAAAEANQLS